MLAWLDQLILRKEDCALKIWILTASRMLNLTSYMRLGVLLAQPFFVNLRAPYTRSVSPKW